MDVTRPYKFMWCADLHGTKPYKFIGVSIAPALEAWHQSLPRPSATQTPVGARTRHQLRPRSGPAPLMTPARILKDILWPKWSRLELHPVRHQPRLAFITFWHLVCILVLCCSFCWCTESAEFEQLFMKHQALYLSSCLRLVFIQWEHDILEFVRRI